MLINNNIAIDVLKTWNEDQDSSYKGRDDRPIPSLKEFEVIIDTLFRASLLREEGDLVSISVTWISEEDFLKYELGKWRETELSLRFDTPIEFDSKTLAKMSGIVNGYSGSLLVHKVNNSFGIWGIAYFEPKNEKIGSIPCSGLNTRHITPDSPAINITGVGSLEISRGNSMIGRIENGNFIKSHAKVLSPDMLGKYLYRLIDINIDIQTRAFSDENQSIKASTYMNSMEYLIEILSQRKMGATIIIVPEEIRDQSTKEFDTSWKITGTLEVDKLHKNLVNLSPSHQNNSLPKLSTSRTLRNRLRSIADLAKMDGALLITSKFEVVAFGAKLTSEKWKGAIDCGPIQMHFYKDYLDFSRLGTRHNSAVNFVSAVKGAIAFVASSDGPIRAITRSDDDKVIYWPDCRISMFK